MIKKEVNMNKNNFNDVIKSKLENYSLPVDDNCWNEIEAQLNPKANKVVLWPWISGIVAASVLVLFWIFPLNQKIDSYETAEQLSGHEPSITQKVPTDENTELDFLSGTKLELPVNIGTQKKIKKSSGNPILPIDDVAEVKEKEKETPVDNQLSIQEEKRINQQNLAFNQEDTNENITFIPRTKKKQSVGLYLASGGKLLAMNDNLNSGNDFNSGLRSYSIVSNAPSYLQDDIRKLQEFSKISHYIPISLGLNLRKELNNTFSVETGLMYSLLTSKFDNDIPRRYATLNLHYVGIPLNLVAKIYGSNYSNVNVYFSAGGSVEKGLLSHYVQTDFGNGVVGGNGTITTTDDKIKDLQWSLNTSLGIEYKFNRNYGIYFEPKLTYYLENNQPFSIRTQNPLIVGVNAGLRYTW